MNISAYFTKFRTMMDELDNLISIPKCTCRVCTCGASTQLTSYEQTLKVTQFLMGLNDQFTTVRGHILMMQPLPSLSQVYALLLQEEKQRECSLSSAIIPESAAFLSRQFSSQLAIGSRLRNNTGSFSSTKGTRTMKKAYKSTLKCDHCHDTGHTKDKCFLLHSYPPWYPKSKNHQNNIKTFVSGPYKTIACVTSPPPMVMDQFIPNINDHSPTSLSSGSHLSVGANTGIGSCTDTFTIFYPTQCHQIMQMIQHGLKFNSLANSYSPSQDHLAGPGFEEGERNW